MRIRINAPYSFQGIGSKDKQEDTLYPLMGEASSLNRVFMVCDGMGGHEKGEVASYCVASTIGKYVDDCNPLTLNQMHLALNQGLEKAYDELDRLDADNTSVLKMGTTLTFMGICDDGVLLGHIGDSRIYQLRPQKGIIFQTRDHSLMNQLIDSGSITPEEALTHPQRHVITRAILPHEEYHFSVSCKMNYDVQAGDIFLLCSDGVLEQVTNEELERILLSDASLQDRMNLLEHTCEERNTFDNFSAYLIQIAESNIIHEPTPQI